MKYFYSPLVALLISALSISAIAQTTTISGQVKDGTNNVALPGVNIIVKGKVVGTITDANGKYALSVNQPPPFTLVFSFIGLHTEEVQVTEVNATHDLTMHEETILGQEVVVSASRMEEKIMESPVSIEKMGILAVQNTSADNYYKGIANLKGVDVTTSSINFQIINTRGFGSTGNTRFVQLTDGMDTQAPALNFPIGNLNGPSELDVESVELIPGASSALYGPNAFNGILLVNSKNAFEYQGLSAYYKQGVNHVGSQSDAPVSPMYDFAARYAKSFNNKFAFKANFAYMQANDWHGTSNYDRNINRTPAGFNFNPGSDLLHYMGDEAAINLAIFPLSSSWQTFAGNNSGYQQNIFNQATSTTALSYAQAGDLPSTVVSVTPYSEKYLIDYNAKNLKANVGLYYRINDNLELSYLYNGGFGTSIYTGAQRYSLKNFGIEQHRLQLRGSNFYVRAYTTMENSGDSYITEFLAKRINDLAVSRTDLNPSANPVFSDVSGYLATYGAEYLRYLYNSGLQPGQINSLTDAQLQSITGKDRLQIEEAANLYARGVVDGRFILDPNSAAFQKIKALAMNGTIPNGPRFKDATRLYHGEFQYDFKNQIKWAEVIAGASYRQYMLRSNGTIFDDASRPIPIYEYGGYVQAAKWVNDRKIKLTVSGRYDRNLNFKGRFNPRLSALFKLSETSNIRFSYQTGFRFPTTQGQYIDLNIISTRLLGGLQGSADKYHIFTPSSSGQNLIFEGNSVQNYSTAVFNGGANAAAIGDPANIAMLQPFKWTPVKPERVQNFEVGYKSIIDNRLTIDASYYYNIYNDFQTIVNFRIASQLPGPSGAPNYATLLNGTALVKDPASGAITGNSGSLYTNYDGTFMGQGAVAGLSYYFRKGYTLSGNYNWNVLINPPDPNKFQSEYNTPEHKFNLSFANRKVTERIGFNVTYRWQTSFLWQSSFTSPRNGFVPAFGTTDAQISYRVPKMKSVVKFGGSNIFNLKYISNLGGPNIMGIYYVMVTFDELFK
ncbi:MAG: TonB-dependent receptor [Bacteroidetes bacterium]|nr:TonB-dependent receptor [Bacteroidota bacterium]MBS1541218.1 TonB-dependent receptor [Bacteroidota bacterium]